MYVRCLFDRVNGVLAETTFSVAANRNRSQEGNQGQQTGTNGDCKLVNLYSSLISLVSVFDLRCAGLISVSYSTFTILHYLLARDCYRRPLFLESVSGVRLCPRVCPQIGY